MVPSSLDSLVDHFSDLTIGIIGDFALDLYFDYQTQTGEQSIETGLAVHWGSRARASLGAAGNVVQNLLALGLGNIWVLGCVGPDLFGREMRHLFEKQGVRTDYLLTVESGWDTCVYAKPMQGATEANRIDFGTHNILPDAVFNQLLDGLHQRVSQFDALVVNQQFPSPLLTPNRINPLNEVIQQYPNVRFVADLRDSGSLLRGATLKVNTAELGRFLNVTPPQTPDFGWCAEQGKTLAQQISGPVVITRGEAGIVYIDGPETHSVEGFSLPGPLDTVGAGDTVVAALTAALSAGASPPQALTIANAAAAVTVQKLGQTGTASPKEIKILLDRIF